MKSRLHKIFACFLVVMISLLFVGCGPDSNYGDNLKDMYENGQLTYEEYIKKRQEAMSAPLYGTKILYRPDDYDWEGNVGQGNDHYYARYAWWLLRELIATYGYTNENDRVILLANNPVYDVNDDYQDIYFPANDSKLGFYDSVRYQLNALDNITLQKVIVTDDNSETVDSEVSYLEIAASTQAKWNWSLGLQANYDGENTSYTYLTQDTRLYEDDSFTINTDNYPDDYYYKNEKIFLQQNNLILNAFKSDVLDETDTENLQEKILDFYASRSTHYLRAYLQTDEVQEDENIDFSTEKYGDYIKALEYAIYCINLDLNPNRINVTFDANDMPVVQVVGYPAADDKTSAEVALEHIQQTFARVGTYVGVTARQQTRLVSWIEENIIGANSQNNFDITSSDRTLVQYVKMIDIDDDGEAEEVMGVKNADGSFTFPEDNVGVFAPQEVERSQNESITVDRHYHDNISAIVDICTTQVQIGNSSSAGAPNPDDPNIDQQYLASHVIDYYGDDFFLSGNNEFKLDALEYQSIAMMFSKQFSFSNLMLGFKYDADQDPSTVDPNASITINVHLHMYTNATNSYRDIGIWENKNLYTTFQIEVKDGPFDYGGKNNTLMLFGLADPDTGGGITCGPFKTDIGNGILASITDGYTGLQSPGVALPLSGNNLRRNFYTHVEGAREGGSYSYGILDHTKFAGPEGCDYFEIAFEVVRVKNSDNTDYRNANYKFNAGIMLIA